LLIFTAFFIEGGKNEGEAFVLVDLTALTLPRFPMRGREPSATRFRRAQKIEGLTKSKKFCSKVLQKLSFIILAKKSFVLGQADHIQLCTEFLEFVRDGEPISQPPLDNFADVWTFAITSQLNITI